MWRFKSSHPHQPSVLRSKIFDPVDQKI